MSALVEGWGGPPAGIEPAQTLKTSKALYPLSYGGLPGRDSQGSNPVGGNPALCGNTLEPHVIAGTYDLTARACADRPDFESQMLAIAWAAVAVALGEIADAFDVESEDLEERAA